MELFGGFVNTDTFLTPASEKVDHNSDVHNNNLSSVSHGHSNLSGTNHHEYHHSSSSQPLRPRLHSTQLEDSSQLSRLQPQYAPQSLLQSMPQPIQHTRPSPWNQGGATLKPSLTSLMDAPPQAAPRSAPRKRTAANGGINGPPDQSSARRDDQSMRGNEQSPMPPCQGGPIPKRQATRPCSSPPRSSALPTSSSSSSTSGGGLLSRPSFAAPRSAQGGHNTALPRNFFRGLDDSSGPGSNDAIVNGALDLDILRNLLFLVDDSSLAIPEPSSSESCIFHVGLVWRDAELSTNFTPTAVKHCTPSQDCTKWFCSCKRAIRASVAFAPLLGCLVHVQAPGAISSSQVPTSGVEEPRPLTVFLPLMPCEGDAPDVGRNESSDESSTKRWAAPYAAFADGAPLPLPSQSSLRERWSLFRELICRHTVVFFQKISCESSCMPFRSDLQMIFRLVSVCTSSLLTRNLLHARLFLCFDLQVAFNAHVVYMTCFARSGGNGDDDEEENPGHQPGPSGVQVFDPKVAGWLLCSSDSGTQARFDFPDLYHTHCGQRPPATSPQPAPGSAGASDGASALAGRGTLALRSLHQCLRANLVLAERLMTSLGNQGLLAAAQELEMPLLPLLAAMEVHGVGFNPQALTSRKGQVEAEMARQASEAQRLAGRKFNVASAEQVAATLYGHLRLTPPNTSNQHGGGTGGSNAGKKHASTKEEVLLQLQSQSPCVPAILRYRTLAKLKGTYIDGLLEFVVPYSDGQTHGRAPQWRLHAEWHQLSVETGRLSASKPAIQCIPRDPEPIFLEAATPAPTPPPQADVVLNVRSAFVASPGCVLVAVDYSQIEMRVLAHFCQDPQLLALFADPNGDVYNLVAAALLSKPVDQVAKQERNLAKTCCLGIIYGKCSYCHLQFD